MVRGHVERGRGQAGTAAEQGRVGVGVMQGRVLLTREGECKMYALYKDLHFCL